MGLRTRKTIDRGVRAAPIRGRAEDQSDSGG
jgi:hypothetical protein